MKIVQKIALLSFAVLAVNTAFAQTSSTTLKKNGIKKVNAAATVKADDAAPADQAAPAAATQKQPEIATPATQQNQVVTKNNQVITPAQLSKQPLQKQSATRREAPADAKDVK